MIESVPFRCQQWAAPQSNILCPYLPFYTFSFVSWVFKFRYAALNIAQFHNEWSWHQLWLWTPLFHQLPHWIKIWDFSLQRPSLPFTFNGRNGLTISAALCALSWPPFLELNLHGRGTLSSFLVGHFWQSCWSNVWHQYVVIYETWCYRNTFTFTRLNFCTMGRRYERDLAQITMDGCRVCVKCAKMSAKEGIRSLIWVRVLLSISALFFIWLIIRDSEYWSCSLSCSWLSGSDRLASSMPRAFFCYETAA